MPAGIPGVVSGVDSLPTLRYLCGMTGAAFNTLKLAWKLEAAGFLPKQAADTAEATGQDIATRQDLKAEGAALRTEIREAELRLRGEIAATKAEIAAAKNETLRWVFGIALAQVGTIVALLKFLP